MKLRAALLATALTLLAACGTSKPTQFLTLQPVPAKARIPAMTGPPLNLGKVTLPAALDRPHLVRQLAGSQMAVDGAVEWIGPLDELFRRILAQDLAARLPEGMTRLPGQPQSNGASIVVTVEQFWPDAANHVTLKANWWIMGPGALSAVISHDAQITKSAKSSSPSDVAGAMSEALATLADQIAAIVSKTGPWAPSIPATQP